MTESQILECIGGIEDPDLGLTLAELGAISEVRIGAPGYATITLKLVQPVYWVAPEINRRCIEALKEKFPDGTFEMLATEMPYSYDRNVLPGVKNIIAVASGKGGVGKSSIAANIAAALSRKSNSVGILDGDVYGPSQPTMFGLANAKLEASQMPDGSVHARPTTKFGIKVASMGFIMDQQDAAIVRGPMLAGYFSMLFEQISWGNLDFLVFDLPPGTGDIQLTLTQKIPLTGAVIVTTPQEIALADVRRSIAMFNKVNVSILGIVENMSYFVPPDMPEKKYHIFGEEGGKQIAEEYGLELLGQVPLTMAMREGNDSGIPMVIRDENNPESLAIADITANIVSAVRRNNYEKQKSPGLQISI